MSDPKPIIADPRTCREKQDAAIQELLEDISELFTARNWMVAEINTLRERVAALETTHATHP